MTHTHTHDTRLHRAVAIDPLRLDDGRVISAQDDDDDDDENGDDEDDDEDEDEDEEDTESEMPPGWSD